MNLLTSSNPFLQDKERALLQIIDRNDHVDENDLGVVIEPTDLPDDVYPFELVDDLEGSGVRGSCAAFATRRDVTTEARYGF